MIEVLTESTIPKRYRTDLKAKLLLEGSEVYEKIVRFKMIAPDSKMRETDCFSTEYLLRIIQSIPSPKAEPFKQRLAKVGYERIQEIDDPELAMERMRILYEKKGYPKNWVEKRERGIAVRHTLTDERKQRGIKENREYSILTDEIYQATFGMTAQEYKEYK